MKNNITRFFLLSLFIISYETTTAQEIGLQLYSLRNQFAKDVPGTMAKVKGWGIREVELGGTYGLSMEDFKKLLSQNNITPISFGADFNALTTDLQSVVNTARMLGVTYVVCHWIPHKGTDFVLDDVKKAVEVFNAAGKVLKENGLAFCYHPHGFEFRPYETGTLFDYLMKNLDANYANFEMDVFWIKHPGQDPVALLKKFPNRFLLMHLKDRKPGTPGNENGQADVETNVVLGTGDVGIAEIMKTAKRTGVKHFFIEDESSRSELQIPLSLAFLRGLK